MNTAQYNTTRHDVLQFIFQFSYHVLDSILSLPTSSFTPPASPPRPPYLIFTAQHHHSCPRRHCSVVSSQKLPPQVSVCTTVKPHKNEQKHWQEKRTRNTDGQRLWGLAFGASGVVAALCGAAAAAAVTVVVTAAAPDISRVVATVPRVHEGEDETQFFVDDQQALNDGGDEGDIAG